MRREFCVDPEIARAATLPSWVYSDPEVFAARERVFHRLMAEELQ